MLAETCMQLLGFVDSLWSNSFGNSAGRVLQEGDTRLTKSAANLRWIDPVVRLAILLVWLVGSSCTLYVYWCCYIKPQPNKYIPVRAVVPDDMKGRWRHGVMGCFGDLGTCCCFTWCPACTYSDYWYRAGWLHATMANPGLEQQCTGWLFFAGVCGWCIAVDVASCCLCCGFAILRGGISFIDGGDGGLGRVVPLRKRFGLPHHGWSTFCLDCCLHCWCGPCAATQEYRQVMDLLNRGSLQEAPPTPIVGNLVTTGTPATVVIGAAVMPPAK